MDGYLIIILRSTCIYLFILIGIRIFGKNQLSQLNTADVILLILISNAVQNAMVGQDTSLLGGIVAASALFILNFVLKKAMFKSPKLKKIIEDEPLVLVKDGVINEKELARVEITIDELEETIREHGTDDFSKVKLVILEVDGNISVITNDQNGQTSYSRHKRKFPRKAHRV